MTRTELEQVFRLNGEIDMWNKELDRLQCRSLIKGQEITNMPGVQNISDKVGDLAIEMADTKKIIEGKLAEIQMQRKKIIEYINSIDNSLMRQILFYRHISCMNWEDVSRSIGSSTSSESLRQQHSRFLRKK